MANIKKVHRHVALNVGSHFRTMYADRLCHVIGLCFTDDGRIITYRWWSRSKRRWVYAAERLEVINWTRLAVRGGAKLHSWGDEQLELPMQ